MVKIITKKKMNLPELIKWGWGNGVIYKTYIGSKGGEVYFNGFGNFRTERDIYLEETFEVEVEEEIDENTVISKLVYHYVHNGMSLITTRSEKSISEVLKINTKAEGFMNIAFYMLNDDYTMTLIWRNGGMVE
ncbi:hypothetical protein BU649_10465 [Staphylococcus chromogenes]|uniref:hypothetical protein n=1 Tax=Staphylococcus chromogenes TaxID=46126 RepID=UPI000D1AFFA8|nr:hypothetical protein [Staphylococcus chromogenes]PTG01838.1 hypothetical protein BU649_10465 [Staphylococcus chromogenes]PTG32021.1 hypothetical protein BU634_09345 [Staphylococcus chromogenes]RIM30161.1 hypothetical protein BU652_06460 [Staphylococcus chromogenes]